jgi:hypothetical protein
MTTKTKAKKGQEGRPPHLPSDRETLPPTQAGAAGF